MNIRRDGEHHQPYAECVCRFPTSLMPGVMVGAAMNTTYGANSAVRRTFKAWWKHMLEFSVLTYSMHEDLVLSHMHAPEVQRPVWRWAPAGGSCEWFPGASRTWHPRGCHTPGTHCCWCPASSGHGKRSSSSCRSPHPSLEVWLCLWEHRIRHRKWENYTSLHAQQRS